MVVLFPVFYEISILFSIVAASIYIPTNSARRFPFFFKSYPAFIVCGFFDDGHFFSINIKYKFTINFMW